MTGLMGDKRNSPGLITGIKGVVIRRRVRRLPAVKSALIHRGRRYR